MSEEFRSERAGLSINVYSGGQGVGLLAEFNAQTYTTRGLTAADLEDLKATIDRAISKMRSARVPEHFRWIKVGVRADYHAVIGGRVTTPGVTIEIDPYLSSSDEWVVFVSGKVGYVACDALTPAEEA